MKDDDPVSEAFYLAVNAIGNAVGVKPLPDGLNTAQVGDWKLTVNVGGKPLDVDGTPLPPYNVLAENTVYLAFGMFGPDGGMIGGYSEDQFIADLKAAA